MFTYFHIFGHSRWHHHLKRGHTLALTLVQYCHTHTHTYSLHPPTLTKSYKMSKSSTTKRPPSRIKGNTTTTITATATTTTTNPSPYTAAVVVRVRPSIEEDSAVNQYGEEFEDCTSVQGNTVAITKYATHQRQPTQRSRDKLTGQHQTIL